MDVLWLRPIRVAAAQLEIIEQTLWRWLLDLPKLLLPNDPHTTYLQHYAGIRKQLARWQKALTDSSSGYTQPKRIELIALSELVCQLLQTNTWEAFLTEGGKGRIPLSASGSGLKTVILVLIAVVGWIGYSLVFG